MGKDLFVETRRGKEKKNDTNEVCNEIQDSGS